MFFAKIWFCIWIFTIHAAMYSDAEENMANQKLSGSIRWKYEKRPFCNAFTGCGKKRAILPYPLIKRAEMDERNYNNNINDEMGEALSDLIDINAEPAVENVQKQIMSQAKIFEAIKEASKEIFRQKTKQKLRNQQKQLALQQQLKLDEAENA